MMLGINPFEDRTMIPRMIAFRLDRRMLRAGITLAKLADAFVAQLSTPSETRRPGIASRKSRPRVKAV